MYKFMDGGVGMLLLLSRAGSRGQKEKFGHREAGRKESSAKWVLQVI
jgi:hypothetical protein